MAVQIDHAEIGSNPNSYEVWYVVPEGVNFDAVINIEALSLVLMAALPGRIFGAEDGTPAINFLHVQIEGVFQSAVRTTFVTPPSAGEQTTVYDTIAAHDPALLTPAQQAAADLAAELATVNANIAALNVDINLVTDPNGLRDQINKDGGLKDQITGAHLPVNTGLKDRLLALADFNALSAIDRDRLLRAVMLDFLTLTKSVLDIQATQLNIDVDEAKSAKTSLKEIKHRLQT